MPKSNEKLASSEMKNREDKGWQTDENSWILLELKLQKLRHAKSFELQMYHLIQNSEKILWISFVKGFWKLIANFT